VTLSALNLPHEIPHIFRNAVGIEEEANGSKLQHEEQLRIARRMREGLVKSAAVVGLPKVCIHSTDSLGDRSRLRTTAAL
jgi:hypothetical protein